MQKFAPPSLTTWDRRFFSMCELLASWSEDRSRRVGAVIVGSANQIISSGFNGLPRRIASIAPRHDRTDHEKYYWFEHAERNALYNAARSGVSVKDSRMYTNLFPCADCTRGIIQSGLAELNTIRPPNQDAEYQRSFEVSLEMLIEAKVKTRIFEIETILDLKNHS